MLRHHFHLSSLAVTFIGFLVTVSCVRAQHSETSSARTDSVGENIRVNPALYSGLHFRMIGPTRGGRVTAVAGHARTPGTFFFGSTGGGVWKTTNYGSSWTNVSDGFFATASIGSIDVADSDPSVIYAGTGSDGIRSNVIIGRGVYRSNDAGETWTFLGLGKTGQIGAVVVHPTNPEVVYVAALGSPFGANSERGVYKSVDGGTTWSHILFVSDHTGAIDLELNPSNPDEVYAAMWTAERKPWTILSGSNTEDGFYRSTDAGTTWTKIEAGLPQGLIGKMDLAVSPADPSRIYALVEAKPDDEGLYRSNDRGLTWRLVNTHKGIMNRPFYYTNVDADPSDADRVYVNNEGFYVSNDAGESFERASTPHGDNHDMWINPDDGNLIIQSNDGGANVTRDGGKTWSSQQNQATAELYQINVDDRFPYRVYSGQQDNSTISAPSLPDVRRPGGVTALWETMGGCETGPAVPKPGNPDIVYSNCKGRFGRFNRKTGQEQQYYVGAVDLYGRNPRELPFRFQRVVPIEVSPHNPDVIYHGSQFVHRTLDEGKTWEQISPDLTAFRPERQVVSGSPITRDITGEEHYSVLYVIEESPVQEGVIWTGANDGPVHVTRDGGETWKDVTPPEMPQEGRIQAIEPSPHTAGKAYVAGYRYLLNDFKPYIYRTEDFGETWTLLTTGENGIPIDSPTRVVREDPDYEGLLYAGTEFGLFISFDDGRHWQSLQLNLPVTPITDLKVYRKDLIVSTMGRAFWILDDITTFHQMAAQDGEGEQEQTRLFSPRDAYRMRYSFSAGNDARPEYPVPGPQFTYFLPEDGQGDLTLSVSTADGQEIRSFSSEAKDVGGASAEQGMRGPARSRSAASGPGTPKREILDATAGSHRFIWDMRYAGSTRINGNRRRGPLAAPGEYVATLTMGEWSESTRFRILIDPRIANDGVSEDDLAEQLSFNLKVHAALTEATATVSEMDSVLAALRESEEQNRATDSRIAEMQALRAEFVDRDDQSYPARMLISQLGYLSGMTSRADQRPGRDAYERYDTLRARQAALISRWNAVSDQ